MNDSLKKYNETNNPQVVQTYRTDALNNYNKKKVFILLGSGLSITGGVFIVIGW